MASNGSDVALGHSGRIWRTALWLVPVLILAFVAVSDLFGWAYLREPIARFVSSKLQRPVEIGKPFRIHLRRTIPVRIGSLSIGAPAWSQNPQFLTVGGIEADIDWGALIGRPPVLRRLAIETADLRLERDDQGRASWSMGSKDAHARQEAGLPVIEDLSIGAAKISIDDAPTEVQMNIEAHTGVDRSGGGRGGEVAKDSNDSDALLASGGGTWKGDPVSFELKTAALRSMLKSGSPGEVRFKGKLKSTEVAFNGSISDLTEFSRISGKVTASGDSLGELTAIPSLTLPSSPAYQLDGTLARDGKTFKVKVANAKIGSSSLSADLEYLGGDVPPLLRGSIDASRLVLQDLGAAIGGVGEDDKKPTGRKHDPDGRTLPTGEFDLPVLRAMNADVDVNLQQLDLGTRSLKPLTSLKTKLLLNDGVLRLKNLSSTLAGGTVAGSAALDASASDRAPGFDAKLNWNRVDLENWLNVAGGKYFVAGRFSGATMLTGSGKSTAAILGSLGGTVKGHIDGGSISHQIVEIAGLDVAQSLGVLFGGDDRLKLSCALVDLSADKGTLRSDLFVLNTKDTLFFVDGTVDLKDEKLNLRLVQSPKDWSPLSLRSPITISGTLAHPSVGVDPGPIALKVLSAVVLGAISPVAALLPLIEPKENDVSSGCGPAIRMIRDHAARVKTSAPSERASSDEGKPQIGGEGADAAVIPRPGQLPGGRP